MRYYGRHPNRPDGTPEKPTYCIAEVVNYYKYPMGRQCARHRGHGPEGLYCKQHAQMLVENRIVWQPEDT